MSQLSEYKKILISINSKHAYKKLKSSGMLSAILKRRYYDIEVFQNDSSIEPYIFSAIKEKIQKAMNKKELKIGVFLPMSLNDYMAIIISLSHAILATNNKKSNWYKELEKKCKYLLSRDVRGKVVKELFLKIEYGVMKYSYLDKYIYNFILVNKFDKEDKPKRIIQISRTSCQKKKVVIDNHVRTIYRVGQNVGTSGISWATYSYSNIKRNVWIQGHALDRIEERLDCFERHIIFDYLTTSVEENKSIEHHGNILIPYFFGGHKLGYLTNTIVDNELIITTFLFITNTGTPEGELLNKKLNINKVGKKFLELDKLSTYLLSDISEDLVLKAIFEECKIAHLFKIVKEDLKIERIHKAKDIREILDI